MSTQNRISHATERITARLHKLAVRGQLGPVRETELGRITGVRR